MEDSMLPKLYCKDDNHIYASLEEITGISRMEIADFLNTVDCSEASMDNGIGRIISAAFLSRFECKINPYQACYFHGTRCLPGTTFTEGLLPVSQSIDLIWKALYSLVQKTETETSWARFRLEYEGSPEAGRPGGYWTRRRPSGRDTGPYGKLIREEWLIERTDNHYLTASEIISIISNAYQCKTGIELSKLFTMASTPCIVHFIAPPQADPARNKQMLGYALSWLYSKQRDQLNLKYGCFGLDSMCGDPVPSCRIIEIEFISTNKATT